MRTLRTLALLALTWPIAPRAFAFTADHLFVGVTGGGITEPVPSSLGSPVCDVYGTCGFPYFGAGMLGVEVGVDSDYGWQLRLHGFGLTPTPGAFDRLDGGTLDLRYVLWSGDRSFQPYVSIGGGAYDGRDQYGGFLGGIFELGVGARVLFFDHLYVGGDAEWVDLYGGSLEGALGWEF
ncbi:MAG: hypothetical protein ACYCWW_03505 [Deltaproteobacteria bacterium]